MWLDRFWQDLRYGFRVLIANPGFTLIAILSLALGIGANTAAFSWADALLLRPLPVERPNELLAVGSALSVGDFTGLNTSYREYVDVRDRAKSFASLAAFSGTTAGLAANRDARPKLALGQFVSANFFTVMGVKPELGRTFRVDEHAVPGRDAVVIVSHMLWQQQLGADPAILGRRVLLNGVELTVVGIMPESFPGVNQYARIDFYVPFMMWPRLVAPGPINPLESRVLRNVQVKGRLAPGSTLTTANEELAVIATDFQREYPETNKNRAFKTQSETQLRMAQSPPNAVLVAMLTTLAVIVLLVACANVAGLLTSRAPARAKEMAMRVAIGAGRARLVRQLLTESLLIAIGGAVVGLLFGYVSIRFFQRMQIPTDLPVTIGFQMDRRALLLSLAMATASAFLFGLAPALQASRVDLTAVMKSADTATGRRRRWGRSVLVVVQVAMAVVLLVVATFMYRGFQIQIKNGPGYRIDHLMTMGLDPGLVRYSEADTARFYTQLMDRVRALPGVKSATLVSNIPMSTDGIGTVTVAPEGFVLPPGTDNLSIFSARVDEDYFSTMAIPIVKGRGVRAQDTAETPGVAIVNETLAGKYWPGQEVLGKRLKLTERGSTSWLEVVGVAKDSKYLFLAERPTDFVYVPYRQHRQNSMAVVAQSADAPASLVEPMRSAVRELDANQPIFSVYSMETFYEMRTLSIFNTIAETIAAMGLMGLALSITGLYGLVAFAVNRRTREIGIRMALGAGRGSVLRMVLRQGMLLAVIGLAIGLLAGAGAQQMLLAAFQSADRTFRPMSVIIVAVLVLAVTFVASYIPARRAAALDPMKALRYE